MPVDFLAPAGQVPGIGDAANRRRVAALNQGLQQGYELGYNFFSINGRSLGQGDPIRVKSGERVLFHVLNGAPARIRSLALPGHTFKVIALDGNPVPTPAEVPVLWLSTAERISAIVEMNQPVSGFSAI